MIRLSVIESSQKTVNFKVFKTDLKLVIKIQKKKLS